MAGLISSYLPYLLLFYFLARSYKYPTLLFILPFLIFLRYCVFFEGIKLFNLPLSLSPDIILLGWLIVTWIIFSTWPLLLPNHNKIYNHEHKKISSIDYIIIGLIILSVCNLVSTLLNYINTTDVLTEFFTISSLFTGFLIIRNSLSSGSLENINELLYSLVILNTVVSVIFIIHQGLHIPIYQDQDEKDAAELFQGVEITRSFRFMPILWYFSIAYLLIFFKTKPIINAGFLAINFLAVFISYNRSSLLNASFMAFLYIVFVALKKKSFGTAIKKFALAGAAAIIFFFAVSAFFPASTKYLMERFKELKKEPADAESNTLVYRFARTDTIISRMSPDKKIWGTGPVTEKQLSGVEDMRAATADMVWVGVIYRWGYIGLLLFGLLFIISLIKAMQLFFKTEGLLSQIAIVLFLTIVSQIIEGFASSTFMSTSRFALGLWYFAVLSALICLNNKKISITKN